LTGLRRATVGALLLALVVALAACTPPDPAADGRPVVAVTIFPVADLVSTLAGGAVQVETLLPPRASPATWEITPRQVRAVAEARGLVSVGAELDGWAARLLPDERTPTHLRLTDGLELRAADHTHGEPGAGAEGDDHEEGAHGDPHLWLDPLLVRDGVLPRLAALLAELAPDSADAIRARRVALADSLTWLDTDIRALLAGFDDRRYVATHGAWSYFAARYDLEPLGSIYERPGHQPSARGLADLVRAGRAAGLRVVLAEPQLASGAGEALAQELDAEIRVVDPLGGPGLEGRESYLSMMRFNAHAFRAALTRP